MASRAEALHRAFEALGPQEPIMIVFPDGHEEPLSRSPPASQPAAPEQNSDADILGVVLTGSHTHMFASRDPEIPTDE